MVDSSKTNRKPRRSASGITFRRKRKSKEGRLSEVSHIEHIFEVVSEDRPILKQTPESKEATVIFDRQEIKVGDFKLEKGFFAEYEVKSIKEFSGLGDEDEEEANVEPNEKSRKPFLIKFLNKKLTKKERDYNRAGMALYKEAMYLDRLSHRNIVKIGGMAHGISAFREGRYDSFFYLMENYSLTLDTQIRIWRNEGSIDTEMRRTKIKSNYLLQIADALLYLHDKRIVVADLKPETIGIIWDPRNKGGDRIILTEFSKCYEIPHNAEDGIVSPPETTFEVDALSLVGPQTVPRYMAPELVTGSRYSFKSDVYSWAMIFYEMYTLKEPFGLHRAGEHKIACLKGDRPSLKISNLPLQIKQLLHRAWHTIEQERFTMLVASLQFQAYLASLPGYENETNVEDVESLQTVKEEPVKEEPSRGVRRTTSGKRIHRRPGRRTSA